jgi:phosphate transport system protein
MAKDLRFLTAALKINTDLERIGDLAVNIAEHSLALMAYPPVPIPGAITTMADLTQAMVRSSVESFVNSHAGVARQVLVSDDAVDALKKEVITDLIQVMQRDSSIVPEAVAFLLVAHNLERIADHATNIAEDVVFMVEGLDVRHHADATP